ARQNVPRVADAEVAHVKFAKLFAIARAAAIIDLQDQRPARRPNVRRIVTRVRCQEHWAIDARRSAMDDTEQRILLLGIEVGRFDEDAFDSGAILTLPGDDFATAERERLRLIVQVRELARAEAARVGNKELVHAGWRRRGEGKAIR